MSGAEMLLYGYGAVCVSMLIFNVIYIFFQKGQNQWLEKRSRGFADGIRDQLDRIRDGEEVDERYIRRMRKKLLRINNLIAFERALDDPDIKEEGEAPETFQYRMQPLFQELALIYKNREDMQAAYFAYFISRHRPLRYRAADTMQDIMLEYIKKNNLYCRVNAMEAFYRFGTPEYIAKAVEIMSRQGSSLNEKILTDGLLSYMGSHEGLIRALWEKYDNLSDRFRLSVLNYIRYKSGDYCEPMYAIMTDAGCDKELRLAAIRYFGKYVYPSALPVLKAFVENKNPNDWEYAAIGAFCLASYPGDDVAAVLIEAMHSSNWYVRSNASVSLESHNLDYNDLIEVVDGRDRYAREMMMYRLDSKRLEEEKARKRETVSVQERTREPEMVPAQEKAREQEPVPVREVST